MTTADLIKALDLENTPSFARDMWLNAPIVIRTPLDVIYEVDRISLNGEEPRVEIKAKRISPVSIP